MPGEAGQAVQQLSVAAAAEAAAAALFRVAPAPETAALVVSLVAVEAEEAVVIPPQSTVQAVLAETAKSAYTLISNAQYSSWVQARSARNTALTEI